jgi:formylglycine-generating enzyme required for sulfatase activity
MGAVLMMNARTTVRMSKGVIEWLSEWLALTPEDGKAGATGARSLRGNCAPHFRRGTAVLRGADDVEVADRLSAWREGTKRADRRSRSR